jgi:hypothetical protein
MNSEFVEAAVAGGGTGCRNSVDPPAARPSTNHSVVLIEERPGGGICCVDSPSAAKRPSSDCLRGKLPAGCLQILPAVSYHRSAGAVTPTHSVQQRTQPLLFQDCHRATCSVVAGA